MKTFEVKFNNSKPNVHGISLVESPATQEMFIYMREQAEIKFAKVDEEKRILLGVVLRPDQEIYRKNPDTGEEFNIVFREEEIEKFANNFIEQGYQQNSKLEHESPIDGISVVQSWTVEDPKKDKATALGLKVVKGDWVSMTKIHNDDIWENYVKTGEVKGFSIDAFAQLEEINLNNDINMSKLEEAVTKGFDDLKTLFLSKEKEEDKKEEIKLGSIPSGDIVIMFDGDTLSRGSQ